MGEDDELAINRLHRFAKRSPRLVLHEYSHCEVPAGCGGVVIRWLDPARGRPAVVEVDVGGNGRAEVALDGRPLEASVTTIAEGTHVLAIALAGRAPVTVFRVSVTPDRGFDQNVLRTRPPRIVAAPRAPADAGWQAPSTYDGDWRPVGEATDAEIGQLEAWRQRNFLRVRGLGERVYASATPAWIRVTFDILDGDLVPSARRRAPDSDDDDEDDA